MPVSTRRDEVALDRVWLVPVLLAAVASGVTARSLPTVLALVAIGLVPWVLGVLGRLLPGWLFGALGVLPAVGIAVLEGINASQFLATTTLCRLASRSHRPWHVAAGIAVGVAVPFTGLASGWSFDAGAFYFAIGNLFGIALGLLLGRTQRLDAELRAADARLADAAAQEERTRLARDVHDLVAHSLTVVVLQVGGARRVLRTDPAAAQTALEQAERVCRESLDGIREVVGLLRAGDDAPGSSLDITRLAETYRAASVEVALDADADTDELPLLVRGTVYRVVREALANAARYRTPGTVVHVRVRTDAEGVSARITNAGSAGKRSATGGYGLTGLREQVAAIGGTLSSGPEGDGWAVECRLPRSASATRADPVAR